MVDYERILREKIYPQKTKPPVKKYVLIALGGTGVIILLAFLSIIGWAFYFNAQFNTYQDNDYKFSIKYPKSWQVVTHPKKSVAVEFIRPRDTALDTIRENFNVTVQPMPPGIFNLEELSGNLRAQMVSVFGKRIVEYRPIQWGWHKGYWMSVAVVKPDNYRLVNVWLIAHDQVYIMTFLGSIEKYIQDTRIIKRMVHSFRLL